MSRFTGSSILFELEGIGATASPRLDLLRSLAEERGARPARSKPTGVTDVRTYSTRAPEKDRHRHLLLAYVIRTLDASFVCSDCVGRDL